MSFTSPAAAGIGVAIAYNNRSELEGSSIQLALNLATIVVFGFIRLSVQRFAFVRRWKEALRRRRQRVPV